MKECTVPVTLQFVSNEGLTKKISFSFFKTWYLVKASWMRTANNSLLILPSCMCHASFHINHLQQLNRKNTLLWCWVRCYFCTCICIGLVKMWMFVFLQTLRLKYRMLPSCRFFLPDILKLKIVNCKWYFLSLHLMYIYIFSI